MIVWFVKKVSGMVRKSEKLLDSEKDMVYLYSEQKKNVYQNNSGSP